MIWEEKFLDEERKSWRRFAMIENNQRHGYYLECDDLSSWRRVEIFSLISVKYFLLRMFGRYSRGVKTGSQWRSCTGGGCLVGEVDTEDRHVGEEVVFLYPDLVSSIVGSFSHGKLTRGHFAHVRGVRKEFGIPVPEVLITPDHQHQTLSLDLSSASRISAWPLLRDQYEARYVYVDQSEVRN